MQNSENSKYLSNFSTARTNYYSWTHWCLVESFVCSEWNTRSKPTEEGSKLEIMPRFLAITVAKLCSAIVEVRLASYCLDSNILSWLDVINLFTLLKLANMAASFGQFFYPFSLIKLENSSLTNWILACKNRFWNWFLQATQAVKIQFEID